MARLSDIIEAVLKQMMSEQGGTVEITRGELAEQVNCVPSQISYVLSTRFTNEHGYIVESRRGGGGWIKITQVVHTTNKGAYVMDVIKAIGPKLTQQQASVYLENFVRQDIHEEHIQKLIAMATSDRSLHLVPQEIRDIVRAKIFRNVLIQWIINEEEKSGEEDR